MKTIASATILSACICTLSSCALITVPVKVAGKVATTSIGVAGKVAGAGIGLVTPNGSESEDE